jgi:hypothetical protein
MGIVGGNRGVKNNDRKLPNLGRIQRFQDRCHNLHSLATKNEDQLKFAAKLWPEGFEPA